MFITTRNRLMLLATSITILILSSLSEVRAQEGSFDVNNPSYGVPEEYEIEEVPNPEEALINPEKDFQSQSSVNKKKVISKAKKDTIKSSSGGEASYSNNTKEAESVLSFNFLYYIIQRFKFTEVVDQ